MKMNMKMGLVTFIIFLYYMILPTSISSSHDNVESDTINLKGGPSDVVWVVQLSDLHFSVHNPERALDFKQLVPPALSMINPSLVLLTGDLTDGKSKDLLTMKQDEKEWIEYKKVMEDVVKRSGLNKNIFYDVRGNHDNFGVPMIGGSFDFFSTYSLNGQLGRSGAVNSVTLQTSERKLLFVGFDSTMSVGLRGPTNLFGHPTDQLLNKIDSALSQWDGDSQSATPVTKISFGHFPLSFSAASESGKTLKDIFLNHSLSAYLCGHLHTRFGKNLKRHHESNHLTQKYMQLNSHQTTIRPETCKNCSSGVEEFWEWEMGDWRKSRAMRILAVDRGYVSFLDFDYKSGPRRTIVFPLFPLDSRFMLTTRGACIYKNNDECKQDSAEFHLDEIRTLVFSASPIVSVIARVYDSRPGHLYEVVEAHMKRNGGYPSRGDLYTTPWNFRAFDDPTPDRFWLQIEATDIRGTKTLSEQRPFSINGLHTKNLWTWKEFFVMGCQWADLYYPILFLFYLFIFSILLIPKGILIFSNKQYTYKNFTANGGFVNGTAWALTEPWRVVPMVLYFTLGYLLYLLLCPWLVGYVFTDGEEKAYMTYKGWVLKLDDMGKLKFHGVPDVMVVVIPHLCFVVLPAILVILGLSSERAMYQDHLLSLSGKKKDDIFLENKGRGGSGWSGHSGRFQMSKVFNVGTRWARIILILVSFAICWKHFKNCRALMKAYNMNPIIHFPFYSLSIPLLMAYTFYGLGGCELHN